MLMAELNRVSSHLMWMATNGMDLGSTSMMIYGFREREMVLAFFEKTTGLRMNHNYIRPGGVAADLPDGWEDDVDGHLRHRPGPHLRVRRAAHRPADLPGAHRGRRQHLGRGGAGPVGDRPASCARPACPGTCAGPCPTCAYDEVDFDVIVGTYGDNFDRYSIRLNEIRESIRIIRQIVETMPPGDYRVQDQKVTPPPRARIDESMEALIHHFKIFTEGFRVPEGEVYVAIESPRGELGCYMVSDGDLQALPHAHPRARASSTCRRCPLMLRGGLHGRRRRRDLVGRPGDGGGGPVSHLDAPTSAATRARGARRPLPRARARR